MFPSPSHATQRPEESVEVRIPSHWRYAVPYWCRPPDVLLLGDDPAMAKLEKARWWTIRRSTNRKAATYRCPLCGYQLHAMTEHMLISPEGDTSRRRHAHTECVLAAREQGRLPLRDDWLATQPPQPSLVSRLLRRSHGESR
jgi:hypothetical protein